MAGRVAIDGDPTEPHNEQRPLFYGFKGDPYPVLSDCQHLTAISKIIPGLLERDVKNELLNSSRTIVEGLLPLFVERVPLSHARRGLHFSLTKC